MTADISDPTNRFRVIKHRLKAILKRRNNPDDLCVTGAFEELDPRRRDMIHGVIGLPEKNARDIMIPRVDIFAVEANTELKPLMKTICGAGHSRVPVYEDTIDNIVGILYVKDLLRLLIERPKKKFQLKKNLHEPYFVPETMPLDELLIEFKARKLHMAVVVDEYGGIGGIITMEDILEEIVGDITDEYDEDEIPEIEQVGRNTYDLDTRMTIADFNDRFGTRIPADNFDTIGGYVYDLFGRIPDKGETTRHENISFKIKEKHGTKIDRVTVTVTKNKKSPSRNR
jgi:magnesium and cobalt transporter